MAAIAQYLGLRVSEIRGCNGAISILSARFFAHK
jgi:hypothetical protein